MQARLCLFLFVWTSSVLTQERVVKTPQGPVRGYKEPGDDIFVFYGVPYATVPKGSDRFMAPYPPSAWLQAFDAVDKGIICPQANLLPNKTMQEDCLIANVFVPNTDKKKLPVVVYVHGGAYQFGFSNFITPMNLVRSKKVIVVTFNYRLGIHGFLCLGTKKVPGNAGMKDQVALLKWIQKNIVGYGGNPEDVTIAGYSVGASSVDLLMLSPTTKGLFNKVIPESGANLSPFSIQLDPLENAKAHAKGLGFENIDDIDALEEFYKSASFDVLTADTFISRTDSNFLFSPCIERNTGAQAFLNDSPYNILKKGKYRKLPILYGFTNMEGLIRLPYFESWKDKMNEDFAEFLPADLKFDTYEEKEEVIKQIKSFYFDGKPVNENNILSFIDYFSDVMITYPTLRAIRFHMEVNHNKVYLYEFNFVDESTPTIPHTDDKKGADHFAQTLAVLDGHKWGETSKSNITEDFTKMKAVMTDLWLNFITTGKPSSSDTSVPEWPATDANGSPYMSLGRKIELGGPYQQKRMRFWHDIYDRYYRIPVLPPLPSHTEL